MSYEIKPVIPYVERGGMAFGQYQIIDSSNVVGTFKISKESVRLDLPDGSLLLNRPEDFVGIVSSGEMSAEYYNNLLICASPVRICKVATGK